MKKQSLHKTVAREEFIGVSSWSSWQLAGCPTLGEEKTVIIVLADTGERYHNTFHAEFNKD
jgi:hypothetical protein